jgi:4-hydroxythreonine-4-phosphate dehydrogenase
MLMVQGNLRVVFTDHIPVSEVASRLTEDLIIEKLKQ